MHPQNTELVFGLVVRAVREALGDRSWRPRTLLVRHPRPARSQVQAEYFACPIQYGSDTDALLVTAEELRRPLARADLKTLPDLLETADRDLATIDGDALGYSELSAFSRAFRKWSGRSALAFRSALVAR